MRSRESRLTRRRISYVILAVALGLWIGLLLSLIVPVKALAVCVPEPASQWAPAGYICDPHYGEGWASGWGGPGSATNFCTFPFNCAPIRVTSLDTGRAIVTTPLTWCMCWVGVTGPNGETERLVDLGPELVQALGLDVSRGLWRVSVEPAGTLPDTAMKVRPSTRPKHMAAPVKNATQRAMTLHLRSQPTLEIDRALHRTASILADFLERLS